MMTSNDWEQNLPISTKRPRVTISRQNISCDYYFNNTTIFLHFTIYIFTIHLIEKKYESCFAYRMSGFRILSASRRIIGM